MFLFQHLQFRFYCFFSHTSFSILTVSAPTLALLSLLCQLPHLHSVISAVSAPRPALPSPLLLFLLLHFSVSAPTPGRTSILFLLPDLHLHLYNFSFQTWISVYVALLSSCTFIFTSSAPITELLSLVILLLSQHLYVFSSAFASTPTLHHYCLCANSITALARSSLPLCFSTALISTYTFIFTTSAPSLRFVLYLHLQIHSSLFHFHLPTSSYFHIDIRISILTSAASLMVLTLTHVTKIYLRGSSQKRFGLLCLNIPLTTCTLVKGRTKKVYFKDILLSKV